jgi:hypothetical protein
MCQIYYHFTPPPRFPLKESFLQQLQSHHYFSLPIQTTTLFYVIPANVRFFRTVGYLPPTPIAVNLRILGLELEVRS